MIYGKFPVTFLSAAASEKPGSTNSIIAGFILEDPVKVQNMGIRELAKACHVSLSSVSRFCKEIGLDSYAELREILSAPNEFEAFSQAKTTRERMDCTADEMIRSIELVRHSVDPNQISKLCQEIARYRKVAVFGLLKAEAAAIDLQCDLLTLGKQVYTHFSYPQQMEYILSAGKEDLIVLFSCTGAYFDYPDLRGLSQRLKPPRIWMVSGEKRSYPFFVDEVLLFDSSQSQGGHPYQLQTVASFIAQEYARIKPAP